jgi:energy-converting hydrogenase Eha subunit E
MKRTNPVMVRLDDTQVRELDELAATVGIPASTLAHNAVLALLRYYKAHGTVTLPLEIISAAASRLDVTLNEPAAPTAKRARRGVK